MSLFLVGYMGSGKSSVGRRLANRLELEFVDMDDAIEEYAQAPVEDIFAKSGEDTFRLLETHILEKLISEGPRIIATGGGSPCHSGNMDKILNSGIAVYLKLSPAKLQRRISQSNKKNPNKRPLVANLHGQDLLQYIVEHLEEREPYYEDADITVNADKVNSAMLDNIKMKYNDWVRSN